jgi:hypothetical protein
MTGNSGNRADVDPSGNQFRQDGMAAVMETNALPNMGALADQGEAIRKPARFKPR